MFGKKRKTGSKILSNSPQRVAQLLAAPGHHRAICILSQRCSAEIISGPGVHFLLKTSRITSISLSPLGSALSTPPGHTRTKTITTKPCWWSDPAIWMRRRCWDGFCFGVLPGVLHAQRHPQPQEKPLTPVWVLQGAAAHPPGLRDRAHLCERSWRHHCPQECRQPDRLPDLCWASPRLPQNLECKEAFYSHFNDAGASLLLSKQYLQHTPRVMNPLTR